MRPSKSLARKLAAAILAGSLTTPGVIDRCAAVVGRRRAWLRGLAERIIAEFGPETRPAKARLERFIGNDDKFLEVRQGKPITPVLQDPASPQMRPAIGPPRTWNVPPILTVGELAQKLNLRPNELAWFADCRTLEAKLPEGPLRHYRYRWQAKRTGSARLIESPKQRLKSIQRFLLDQILNQIPPHEAAHGFRARRSIRTFVAPHIHCKVVLRLDLRDFFPGIFSARVLAIFLTAGYPEPVAQLLTGLCTNTTPADVVKSCPVADPRQLRQMKLLYQRPHLPQGAPTSPALANLAAYRLDCRLAGLAAAAGASYTRYADDLVFSGDGDFTRMIDRFYIGVCAIALEEGFEINTRKTRMMRRSVSQRAAGVVLNQHPNVPRAAFDQLKAIIHNCVLHGPREQNQSGLNDFRAHLDGRIAHVEMLNLERGRKLRAQFEKIQWGGMS